MIRESNRTDPHTKAAPPREEIPILDAVLHVLSMSVIVFTRYKFGYAYLKPASHFLLISLALSIFTGFAWTSRTENQLWQQYFPLIAFSFTWLLAYFGHCIACNIRQWIGKAPLDNASGISSLENWYVETILTFGVGAGLFYYSSNLKHLGLWLMVAATALSIKEALNSWYRSRIETVRITSEKKSETLAGKEQTEQKPPPVRKPSKAHKKKPQVKPVSAPDLSAQKIKFASILGLEPPYTLTKAEKAFRQKHKDSHPDSNPNAEQGTDFQQLREAIQFFRKHYS